jgi:succinate dehydrogenase flavin-adding protein (antitoxin of CptAB toxin-antitoxin module)
MVEKDTLLGCFAQEDIQTIENNDASLAAYKHLLNSFFTDENATVLELLKIFADNDNTIITDLNKEKKYIG